jgi:tRNA A-37 threonylcarbamoyl transferase component Bud32
MTPRCAPGAESLVQSVLEGRFPSETVKESGIRVVRRVAPPGGPALYLKLFRDRGLGAAVRRLVADRAAREYAVLDHLRRAGVGAAEPVACGLHDGASFLITREIPGAEVLKDRLARAGRAERTALLVELGRFIRAVHDAGVRHDDLHLGNVLVPRADGPSRFALVDVHRAAIDPGMGRAGRVAGLGFLLHALYTLVGTADQIRFLRAYWGERPSKPLLRDLRRAFAAARERYAEDRTGRCLVTGREFERAGGMCLRRPLTAEAAREILEAPPQREVKRVGRRRLWLAAPDRFVREGPRAKRIWRNAHAFAVRHVATPRLWARAGDRILGEWLPDAVPLNEHLGRRAGSRRVLAEALARFVAGMHRSGVHHGDLKANNILVREGPSAKPEFWVVDLDRAAFFAEVPLERRLSDLAQLNAALGPPATVGDRVAFYKAYAGREADWIKNWKERVREIMRQTKARRHVWPA